MVRNELAATHYNAVERHAAQNEGQSPKRAGIFGVAPDLPPKGPIWRDDAWQSVADNAVLKTQTQGDGRR